jgi:DNA-binding CsgD family transcriptional regulator
VKANNVSNLTKREAEIAILAVRGQTCSAIAASLFLSVNTVKTHLGHIYDKTGTNNRLQLYILLVGDQRLNRPGFDGDSNH